MSEPTLRGAVWTDDQGAPATSEEARRRLKSATEASEGGTGEGGTGEGWAGEGWAGEGWAGGEEQ